MELFKIESFMSMVKGCSKVFIPYKTREMYDLTSKNKGSDKFDKLLVEQWPLIQAYAVEGVGR